MRGRSLQPLLSLGLLLGLFCMLAGCGSNEGSGTTGNRASRSRQLALQFQLSSEAVSPALPVGPPSAQARQVQPGDPGFIARLEVRLQAQGSDFVSPQVFILDSTQQETATIDVAVPDTAPATFEVLVSAFTSQDIEAYRGQTTVARGQTSAVVPLPRFAFVPVPATADNLQQTTFNFTDGAVFGLANTPVTLATGTFVGDVGDFALTASGAVASGSVTLGSCTFVVTTTSFSPGQGLQIGDTIVIDPCQIDAIDRRLIATNASVSLTPTISSTPVLIPSDTTLNLPPPLTLTIAEDAAGTVQIVTSVSGTRSGTTALGITIPPAQGTASLTSAGVVTYQPAANFNGSDSLVVTVIATFSDNNSPSLLLGTVPISITVQAVGDPPVPTGPSITTSLNTPGTIQIGVNDPDAGQMQTFSISIPPANGTATVTASGVVTYTPASGFSGLDSFVVTVTDNDTPSLSGMVTIQVTVQPPPPNQLPMLASPGAQSNAEGDSVRLQFNASDPDGNLLTFNASGLPRGLNMNAATGLVSGTIAFGAATSIPPLNVTVTVTDNGMPPLRASVSFPWTIAASVPVNTLRLVAPVEPVGPGTSFPVTVYVNAGATDVLSYLFELTFDPAVVMVASITPVSALFEPPITNLGTSAAGGGAFKFAANNPTFASAANVLTLATIMFQVVGSPGTTSLLTLQFPPDGVLVDRNFQAMTLPSDTQLVTVK